MSLGGGEYEDFYEILEINTLSASNNNPIDLKVIIYVYLFV